MIEEYSQNMPLRLHHAAFSVRGLLLWLISCVVPFALIRVNIANSDSLFAEVAGLLGIIFIAAPSFAFIGYRLRGREGALVGTLLSMLLILALALTWFILVLSTGPRMSIPGSRVSMTSPKCHCKEVILEQHKNDTPFIEPRVEDAFSWRFALGDSRSRIFPQFYYSSHLSLIC